MKIKYDELIGFTNVKMTEETKKIEEILEYEEILYEISKCIKNYRREHKLTQKEIAKLLNVDQVMISKLESGNYNPTFKQIHKISRKLNNSAELFIEVLNNIVDNLEEMHRYIYDVKNVKIVQKVYSNQKKTNKMYSCIYNCNYSEKVQDGGLYGAEKNTSKISIAG